MVELLPLNKSDHKNLKIRAKSNFQFAAQDNLCPIVLLEVINVLKQAPIVFLKGEKDTLSIFMLQSFYPNSNFFVDEKGGWKTNYIPSFYRIKPFSLVNSGSQDQRVLCFEKDSPHICTEEEIDGSKVFDDEGEPSEYLRKIIEFTKIYEQNKISTAKATEEINKCGILEEYKLKVKVNDKEQNVKGLWKINEQKFLALDKDHLHNLLGSNALQLIYAHLFSIHSLVDLANLNLKERQVEVSSAESLKDRAVKKQKAEDKKQLDNLVKNLLIEDE